MKKENKLIPSKSVGQIKKKSTKYPIGDNYAEEIAGIKKMNKTKEFIDKRNKGMKQPKMY